MKVNTFRIFWTGTFYIHKQKHEIRLGLCLKFGFSSQMLLEERKLHEKLFALCWYDTKGAFL